MNSSLCSKYTLENSFLALQRRIDMPTYLATLGINFLEGINDEFIK
jgi:hypothetical protein